MKKWIALALILIIPAVICLLENNKYSLNNLADVHHTDLEKSHPSSAYGNIKMDSAIIFKRLRNIDSNWEYIKNNLFNPNLDDRKTYSPVKLKGPLLIVLKNATQEDSLAFKSVMKDLRKLIPNKTISFFSDYKGITHKEYLKKYSASNKFGLNVYQDLELPVLQIRIADFEKEKFIKETTEIKSENISYTYNNHPDYMWFNTEFFNIDSYFNLSKRNSFTEKKDYVQYKLLRLLCLTYPLTSKGGVEKEYPKENIFNARNKNPWNRKLTEKDEFLLEKLFSNDFEEQFSDYMYKAYDWRYATFFLNPGLAKLIAFLIVFSIAILVFILLFYYFQNKRFKKTYLNYLFPCLAVSIYTANIIVIYLYLTNMDLTRYFEQWSAAFVMASLLAIFYSFLLWALEKLIIRKTFKFSTKLFLKIVITFIVLNLPLVFAYFVNAFQRDRAAEFLQEKPTLPIFIGLLGLTLARGLLIYLNEVSLSLVNAKDVELSKLKELHSIAEMKLLQSQINPHFLYNSLNSIASLAKIDADKTQNMAYSLSDLFKYSINRKGKKMGLIKDEIEMVESYLSIEKIRFGKRLQYDIQVDETLLEERIPLFLLQPLVENAVKHGISKNKENGEITLKIGKESNTIKITVGDNGSDFPDGLVSGHGLQTVFDLLRLSYGDKAKLNWTNTPQKQIVINIPK